MATTTIPADVRSPGQVFACLGLMELAGLLAGNPIGEFHLRTGQFTLATNGDANPSAQIFDFLARATLTELGGPGDNDDNAKMTRPVLLHAGGISFRLDHWADASSCNAFKLYAGNRSAFKIAGDMLDLVRNLFQTRPDELLADPWNACCPMAGSFNFDPRGAWTATDAGFSPNNHSMSVLASPALELCAAIGLQHARPRWAGSLKDAVSYAAWEAPLPLALARAALGGCLSSIPQTQLQFHLQMSGKNKVVTFAQQEV